MTTIFIVEDDGNIQEIEEYVLKNNGYGVEKFSTGAGLFQRLEEKIPALILLDLMLPDEDGLEILKKIRGNESQRHIPIIVVTAKSTEIDKVKGLDSGADDYMTKPFGIMELSSRVKAILRRTCQASEETILEYRGIVIDNDKRCVMTGNRKCELTYKEFELLKYLIMNKGIALSRDKIMTHVWGVEYEGVTRTVDIHIKKLREKLGEAAKCIKTIRNVGYIIE